MQGKEQTCGRPAVQLSHVCTRSPCVSVNLSLSSLPGSLSQSCEHSPLLPHLLHPEPLPSAFSAYLMLFLKDLQKLLVLNSQDRSWSKMVVLGPFAAVSPPVFFSLKSPPSLVFGA